MKKTCSFLLVAVLLFTLAVPTFATSTDSVASTGTEVISHELVVADEADYLLDAVSQLSFQEIRLYPASLRYGEYYDAPNSYTRPSGVGSLTTSDFFKQVYRAYECDGFVAQYAFSIAGATRVSIFNGDDFLGDMMLSQFKAYNITGTAILDAAYRPHLRIVAYDDSTNTSRVISHSWIV